MTEQMLRTSEREILRRIMAQCKIKDVGVLNIRNSEIYYLYKYLNIVKDIKIRRLRWAGYIIRMEGERIQKRFLKENVII